MALPNPLDEYESVLDWVRGDGGRERGGRGGDRAGSNMTASLAVQLREHKRKPLAGMFLLYPEVQLPFATEAARENSPGHN